MADSAICVAVRSRPLLKNEAQSSDNLIFEGNSTVHSQKKTYTFDYVFRPGVTNETVYNTVVAQKIHPIFEGYNVTILAYGPTGSGKTYTMGTDYNPKTALNSDIGIIPRAISEIFRFIESQKESVNFIIKVSFLELYGEEIFDLLQKKKPSCNLRDDGEGIRVTNLKEVPVESVEEAFLTLEKGCSLRHTGATAKNVKSSRSHAIFSVYIEQTDKKTFNFKRSKFQLVDLAGSERMGSSKTIGLQVKEGININLGLLCLGKVISNLIEERQHIPYRDSKLTRLLQDSLGGNSHTIMIACVNPSLTSTEETLSTLRYASNARRIKNRPVVNVDPPAVQIEKLKKQVDTLQTALYECQGGNVSTSFMPSASGNEKAEELRVDLHKAFSKIPDLVDKITKLEDKCGVYLSSIQSLYEKIKLLVADMTAVADPSFKDHLEKLKEIESLCFQLMTNYECGVKEQSAGVHEEESEDAENLSLESELELKTLEEITDKQKASFVNLNNIDRTLNLKYNQVKSIKALFQNFETSANEDYINNLMNQIQELVQEKNKLQEHMKEAEERVRTESQQKIEDYEKQIHELQADLRKRKFMLRAKEENQIKVNQLNSEIIGLKKTKVDLVKRMKLENKAFLQKQRENEREVAKLVREGRRKQHELVKIKNKFEKEASVLRQKIERLSSLKTNFMKKTRKISVVKSRPSITQENIEQLIFEELRNEVDKELAKRDCEHLEKESESLKQQIKNMEEVSEPVAEGAITDEEDINSQKSLVEIMAKQISEVKESVKTESGKPCSFLESLNSMGQAKAAIEALFKKCVSEVVLQVNHQENLKVESTKTDLLTENCTALKQEIEKLNEKIQSNQLEFQYQKTQLAFDCQSKVLNLMGEYSHGIKSAIGSVADPALLERIEAQEKQIQMQEKQHLHFLQDYDHKCKEVAILQQQLLQAKKGKKATWLGNITHQSVTHSSTFTSPEEKASMLDEFLSDSADESFGNDEKDPDWRLTPAYKRQKELRTKKESRKRQHAEESTQSADTSDTSPKKKIFTTCRCRTTCKSMRCVCKKNQVKCGDQCNCSKDNCLNLDKVGATHDQESLEIMDDKQVSFVE